jgi:hypothetical protein
MLTKQQDLAIAVLVYFVLALPVAILVCKRQGFGRHAGWLYLLSLTIVRIIGSSLEIAAVQKNSLNLYITAGVFASIGLVPLILTLNGIVKRTHDGLESGHLPPRVFQFIHVITVAALVLGIISGSQAGSTNLNTLETARKERKAAAVLLLISAVINSALAIYFVAQLRRVFQSDRKLAMLAAISAPFMMIRLTYTMLLAFSTKPKFNSRNPNIYVQAFMQSLMEFILFAIYATAGFMSQRIQPGDHKYGSGLEFLAGRRLGRKIHANDSAQHNSAPPQ